MRKSEKERKKERRERKKRKRKEREKEREIRERKFRAKIQRDPSPLQILLVWSSINKEKGSEVELFLY